MTGEHPDVNNIGVQHPITVHISPGSTGQAYAYPLTGEHMTGTVPDESYLAYVEGVHVKIVPTAQGAAYAYPLTATPGRPTSRGKFYRRTGPRFCRSGGHR